MSEQIDNIRKLVEDESLSFIIGAGFSKNISSEFPLWGDLLAPLAEELYPEIHAANGKVKDELVRGKMAEKGYLGIASEYVRRKGYHEAIDLYIEKRMPYLQLRCDGGYILVADGKVVDENPSVECHEKLLNLGVNHIFTFNYDNALDILADVDLAADLLQRQGEATREFSRCNAFLEKYERLYSDLGKGIHEPGQFDTESPVSENCETDYSVINAEIERSGLKLTLFGSGEDNVVGIHQDNLRIVRTEIARWKSVIVNCKEQRNGLYQLITDAYQISLTDGCRNIYKLHGNLRISPDMKYEFDGDRHVQYIITEEDYAEYPSKHEAFVNLMRISLLKGAFCLIGFSGDDPNFMAWINWVKDVLDRGGSQHSGERPIYYINSGDFPLDDAKRLLLENHYIEIVDLFDCFPGISSDKGRIIAFLDSIGRDRGKYEVYDSSWKEIDVGRNRSGVADSLVRNVGRVYDLSDYNRIPDQSGIGHYCRTNLFSQVKTLLGDRENLLLWAKALYSAIKGELMPVNAVLSDRQVRLLAGRSPELKEKYRLLMMRARNLEGRLHDFLKTSGHESECTSSVYVGVVSEDVVSEDVVYEDVVYEVALDLLFHLRFADAKRMLSDWKPESGIGRMRRLALLAVFGDMYDADEITRLICRDNFECLQDYKYALDMLPFIRGILTEESGGVTWKGDLQSQIERLDKHNPKLVSLGTVIENLVREIREKGNSQPYGNKRHSVRFDSYDPAFVNSLKILQIFLEFGMPTEAGNVLFFGKEKWMAVCENLYEEYPYPCLYFSLLYGNSKDMVRRMAQNYVFSARLYDKLPELLSGMLSALLSGDCPFNVREAVYIAAPVFMKAVPSDRWESLFEKVFDSFDIFGSCDFENGRMRVNEASDFIIDGAGLVRDEKFRHRVLLSALKLGAGMNGFHNSLIIGVADGLKLDVEERAELDAFCRIAATPSHFYILMNLDRWVDKGVLAEKLVSLSDDVYGNCTLLKAASRYAKYSPVLESKLKNIVLGSSLLWQTGISDDYSSLVCYGSSLDICAIQKNVSFSREEIVWIYRKMQDSCLKIEEYMKRHAGQSWTGLFDDWRSVLTEMHEFVLSNGGILKSEDGLREFGRTKRTVVKLLSRKRGGTDIASLMADDSKTHIAIEWLVDEIVRNGPARYEYEYVLLANKIILHESQFLDSCFVHFGWALTAYADKYDKKVFKRLLKSMLDSYMPYFRVRNERRWDIEYAGKNIVERELLRIYGVYRSWGGKSAFWDKYVPRYFIKS